MKYWSQAEVEEMFEYLYQRQAVYIRSDKRDQCDMLQEAADLVIDIRESGFEAIDLERGRTMYQKKRRCSGKCDSCPHRARDGGKPKDPNCWEGVVRNR